MCPFLLGLGGWTVLLFWTWVRVGHSLGGPVWGKTPPEKRPAVGANPEEGGHPASDNVITIVPHD